MPDNPTQSSSLGTTASAAPSAPPRAVQSLYFNGFSLGISNADFVVRLNLEHTELMDLRMSFTMAKTLAEKLGEAVTRFEKHTEHKLMTTDTVFEALKKAGIAT